MVTDQSACTHQTDEEADARSIVSADLVTICPYHDESLWKGLLSYISNIHIALIHTFIPCLFKTISSIIASPLRDLYEGSHDKQVRTTDLSQFVDHNNQQKAEQVKKSLENSILQSEIQLCMRLQVKMKKLEKE